MGCLGYADNLLLLSDSRSRLQSMVNTCQKFTKKKNLKFGTNPDAAKSETKCIVFSKKAKDLKNVSPILLNGDPLPWVQQVKHLGNVMQCDNSMKIDCTLKRGKFIGKVNSLLQEFYFADPKVKMRLMNIFASSFYGSGLWDLQSRECDRLFNVTFQCDCQDGVWCSSHHTQVPDRATGWDSPCKNNAVLQICQVQGDALQQQQGDGEPAGQDYC